MFFFVVMKSFNICLLLLFITSSSLIAQEIDTVPIETKGMEIKLKRSPLPSRNGILNYTPVKIPPVVIAEKVNYWKQRTSVGININQGSFSNNWKAGGVNSIAVGGLINYRAEYRKEGYGYVSEVMLEYGKVKNKDQLQKKTRDRIFWDNKADLRLSKSWYFFGSITFESQFDRGYAYYREDNVEKSSLISKFMSPGYLTESIGFEYRPVGYFSTRIGTGTAKQTFKLDTAVNKKFNGGNYGVEYGKNFKNELAFQIVSNFDKQIFKNVNLKARYQMFIPYDRPVVHIDHRLDVELRSQINRLMNVTLTGVGLFDKDSHDKIQASEALALGVAFTFPR